MVIAICNVFFNPRDAGGDLYLPVHFSCDISETVRHTYVDLDIAPNEYFGRISLKSSSLSTASVLSMSM